MADEVRDSYDAMSKLYAELFLNGLDGDTNAREWLAKFATGAATQSGPVADLGCGPGPVVHHLSELGLAAVGYDISPGQIKEARQAFPQSEFHVGDLGALDIADSSLGGIVSRYSLIHMVPSLISGVLEEWMRVLEPGAPVLVSFFGAVTEDAHGTAFDHKVVTAYALFPATIAQELRDAGFTQIEVGVVPPPEGGRPLDQATLMAHKPGS